MASVVLVIHLVLALAIIALVMIQRSEGGGLGIGGGGGGAGGLATAGQTANILTRMTGICAAGFFTTSLILAILAGSSSRAPSMLDSLENTTAPAQASGVTGDAAVTDKQLPGNVDPAAPATDEPTPRAKDLPATDKTTKPDTPPSAPISE